MDTNKMAKQTGKRKIRQGNDIFCEIQIPNSSGTLIVSNWDMWFLVVLINEFNGDWEELSSSFHQRLKRPSSRDNAESKLSHLLHLKKTMEHADINPIVVLGEGSEALLKKEKRAAINKIIKQVPREKEKSYWMIHTPRYVREKRALRGYWICFPVSPEIYAEPLTKKFKTRGYYKEKESFGLEKRLSSYLNKQSWSTSKPELIALFRAFLTVMLEKIEMVDDSYGVIGQLYEDIFSNYIVVPRLDIGLSSADFLQDILELLIWEDYGFMTNATPQFFANLSSDDAAIAKNILQIQQSELAALELVYQAEQALTLLGMLAVQQEWFSQFATLAQKMGTRAWKRITTMAEAAEAAGDLVLATAVYQSALSSPGMHQNYIQEKQEVLG